ncbi:MAG: response regulator [Verrucomicrobiota bacterium]
MKKLINSQQHKQILYIDDEEQALKYFKRTVGKKYDVLMASSAEEGWKLIQENHESIAVIFTDQRMPGTTGVDLLSRVSQQFPNIIRILTTAYSDLDSAISSVNEGAIYRYVVKPWNFSELEGIFRQSFELYDLIQERNQLIREKMSIMHRQHILSRIQGLTMLSQALGTQLSNSNRALNSFIDLIPKPVEESWQMNTVELSTNPSQTLPTLCIDHSGRAILETTEYILNKTVRSMSKDGWSSESLQTILENAVEQADIAKEDVSLSIDPDIQELNIDSTMLSSAIRILLESSTQLEKTNASIAITAKTSSNASSEIHLKIRVKDDPWTNSQLLSLFALAGPTDQTEISKGLLTSLFVIHHHGGSLSLPTDRAEFVIQLPVAPEDSQESSSSSQAVERLLTRFDSLNVSAF